MTEKKSLTKRTGYDTISFALSIKNELVCNICGKFDYNKKETQTDLDGFVTFIFDAFPPASVTKLGCRFLFVGLL